MDEARGRRRDAWRRHQPQRARAVLVLAACFSSGDSGPPASARAASGTASANAPSIASLDREASRRWDEKKGDVLQWEDSPRLSDKAIGIREYVHRKRKGTGGMLKSSWSDFRVTEVSAETRRPIQLTHSHHPGERPPHTNYLRFVMAKIGYDTISAVGRMCTWLGCARDAVTFAGIKDKSAVTCQAMSLDARAKPVDIEKLRNISRWIPRILVGQFEWSPERLTPGMHAGNYFTILLRDVSAAGARRAGRRVASVRRRGFLNYYGHQRFGLGMRSSMPTVKVGKALLLADWDEAVAQVMSAKFVSHPRELAAKKGFAQRWRRSLALPVQERRRAIHELASGALAHMPEHCFGEIAMLRGLTEHKTARQCLFLMPHRAMYMLAYWSWLWNKVASRRVRIYGAKNVVEGDLVSETPVRDVYGISDGTMNVTMVTRRDARKGRYSVRELVLPLPGRAVSLQTPANKVHTHTHTQTHTHIHWRGAT
jgi:TruD family tRNA pseudouridine synthase